MSDMELLGYRIAELQESVSRLAYMHGEMVQCLTDIARQSKESNERTLARLCLAQLELDKEY